MAKLINFSRAAWLTYKPSGKYDVRKRSKHLWSVSDASEERKVRIEIMARGSGRRNFQIMQLLSDAEDRRPANVGCCPLLARLFQVYFASRALRVSETFQEEPERYTLFDISDAVPFGQLHTIDWRKLHNTLRRRLERILGKNVVAYGMGEVEADESRGMWQPHYHLVIHNASNSGLSALRRKHYKAKRTGPRPMLRSRPQSIEKWLTYISKQTVFGKSETDGPSRRVRLNENLSREYFRYLSVTAPTKFVFSMRCRIVKSKK